MPAYGVGLYGAGAYGGGSGAYTNAQIDAALRAATRTIAFRYDRLDATGVLIGPITTMIAASIAYDSTAAIRRTARFSLTEDAAINYLSDQIKVWFRLKMPDGSWIEWPLGVFLLSTPPRVVVNNVVHREIEGYDRAQILLDDKVIDRYTVAPGASYLATVRALLESAGLSEMSLTPSALTLPAWRDWDPGTPKLTIINDLLMACNYRGLFFDGDGVAQAVPFINPAERAVDFVYQDDAVSVTLPGMSEHLDLFGVPNEWVAVVSQADRPALRASYTNTNPDSPTSTVARGRTVAKFDTGHDAADQATLNATVARMAFEDSQVFEEVTFQTGLMPGHGDFNIIYVGDTTLGLGASYNEVKWEMPLQVGGQMAHTVRRIVVV